MRGFQWFILLGSILFPMCSALMLNESKTYALRVPDTGFFTFIICGNITGNGTERTKICYDGKAKGKEHLTCQKKSYCGIQVSQNPGSFLLNAYFGDSGGFFNETCAKIQVEKHKQIALNSKDKVSNGTCTWNATDEGKLLVDVTLSEGFTVEVENAVLYQEMMAEKPGLLAEQLYWIIPVGSVIGIVAVVVIIVVLVHCFCCKKKKQPEVEKQPLLATIPPSKPVGSTTVEIDMIEELMTKEGSFTPNAKRSQSNVLVEEQGDAVKRQPSKTNVLCVDQPLNAPSFVSTPNVEKCAEEKQIVQPEIVKDVCPQIVATSKTPIVEMEKHTTKEEVKQEKVPLKTSGVEKVGGKKEVGKKDKDKLEIKKDDEKTTTEEKAGKATKTKTTNEDDLRTGRLSNVSTPSCKTPRISVDGNKKKDSVGIKNDAQKTTTEEEPQPGPSKMETKIVTGRDGRKMEVKREVATTQKGIKKEAVSSKMPKLEGIPAFRGGTRKASGSELEEEETQASEISNVAQRLLKEAMSGESKKKVKSKKSSKKTKSGKSEKTSKPRRSSFGCLSLKERHDLMARLQEEHLKKQFEKMEKMERSARRQIFGTSEEGQPSAAPELKTAEEAKTPVDEFFPAFFSRGLLQPKVSTAFLNKKKRCLSDPNLRHHKSFDDSAA